MTKRRGDGGNDGRHTACPADNLRQQSIGVEAGGGEAEKGGSRGMGAGRGRRGAEWGGGGGLGRRGGQPRHPQRRRRPAAASAVAPPHPGGWPWPCHRPERGPGSVAGAPTRQAAAKAERDILRPHPPPHAPPPPTTLPLALIPPSLVPPPPVPLPPPLRCGGGGKEWPMGQGAS